MEIYFVFKGSKYIKYHNLGISHWRNPWPVSQQHYYKSLGVERFLLEVYSAHFSINIVSMAEHLFSYLAFLVLHSYVLQ